MENWDKDKHFRDHRKHHHHRENPSFSSTLLDAIYRSIDEGQQLRQQPQSEEEEAKRDQIIFYRDTSMRKLKHTNSLKADSGRGEEAAVENKQNSRRARKVENWIENKGKDDMKVVVMGRNSLTELERKTRSNSCNALSMYSSSTSSSESSSAGGSGGGFSSSESESFYSLHRPKPIRTSLSEKPNFNNDDNNNQIRNQSQAQKATKHDSGNSFGKTKSKALRILYGDLKKTKQPISPGAKLASFLNSLFTSSGSAKKAKVLNETNSSSNNNNNNHSQGVAASSNYSSSSACSSTTSFSRSCLSKTTPSSRTGGAKRSVRFCPVSVIVDEDCRPCGHKNLHVGNNNNEVDNNLVVAKGYNNDYGNSGSGCGSNEDLRFHVLQESRRVEELARDLLKNYQKKKKKKNEQEFDMTHYDDDYEDDDDASCASSDLFELDNLSAIGIERYREELPVYETTHFSTNRAIASGFIL